MFDIGFGEMMVCAIVALVVIGPESCRASRARSGILFGRLQRYVAQVKTDIHREMEAADLGKVKTEFESAARSFQSEVERRRARDRERGSASCRPCARPRIADAAARHHRPKRRRALPASPQLELGIEERRRARGAPAKQASG
jgi:sec-independent protein translocase protein TatB